jgi:hypothetical protein
MLMAFTVLAIWFPQVHLVLVGGGRARSGVVRPMLQVGIMHVVAPHLHGVQLYSVVRVADVAGKKHCHGRHLAMLHFGVASTSMSVP